MPRKNCILNLPGFTIKKMHGFNPVIMEVSYCKKPRCSYCGSKSLRKKASFMRQVHHESVGPRCTVLRFQAHKFHCRDCRRYFNQQFPGIGKYQRATQKLKQQIFHQHTEGISQKDLAKNFKLGKATIERWYHGVYKKENQEFSNRCCPSVLGIDEHSFNRKSGYATTFCDLKRHKIFDVVKGKSKKDLASYLNGLSGRERVKVVCIDLSSSYKSLIKAYFPNAKIVADRFHVIRLLNQMSLQSYHAIDPSIKYQRGLLAALRTRIDKLTPTRFRLRETYLKQQPTIAAIDHFKQRLHRLLKLKHRNAKQCRRLLPLFLKRVQQLKESRFPALVTLGRTLHLWREEIVRMWRFTRNNGITEGFHRKMKLIQRRAYGFRNFENYRLRVKVLCA